ncbi:MAG TPA: hypothetical protein VJ783_24190 [Pirellulales bacterium]|nr:hypothetical protein [Pirellulales bacterium]
MPIPAAFRDAMRRRGFWVDYLLTEGAEWPEFKRGCQIAAPVGGGYEIVVALTDLLYETNLYLRRPGAKKLSWMGRNDLANWPRDVLRWEETLLITEAAARIDADFAASDVLLVLLYPFTPLTDEDDRKQIHARMRKAYASLGVLSTSTIHRCVRHCLSDATGNIWWQHPKHGWVLKQNPETRAKVSRSWHPKRGWVFKEATTEHYEWPRSPDGPFPFKHFAGLIEAANLTCERRARRTAKRRGPAAPLAPRSKPKPTGLGDGVFTRAMLKSARCVFARGTPMAVRKPLERAFKASVAEAVSAMDVVPKAKAVVISNGRVAEVLTRMPAKRKLGVCKVETPGGRGS